ncbi:uncharacterized protein LOC128553925 [Mercenaria mercenaria]|uniref:uncharacterized protein LOC128553925 n=1 Tax=Mercenaria mercenaria TaxID=6596 RepID=UPI00234E91FD|nr:uncharacterized protein LOC128553925 [Mercenaria mercenaria]
MDRDEDYQNFVVVYRGLSYIGKLLEPYTENGIQRIHQDIYKVLGGYPPCQSQCSLQYGKNMNKWCNTCKEWKKRLARTTRIPFESWQYIEFWKWPTDFKSIADIYLPKGSANKPVDLRDISVSCHIWRNSINVFQIRWFVIQHLRDARNRYFAQNIKGLHVTRNEKAKAFDAFRDAIKEPDVKCFVNQNSSLKELEKIKDGDELTSWMNKIDDKISNSFMTLDSIMQNQNDFAETVTQALDEIQKESIHNVNRTKSSLFQKFHVKTTISALTMAVIAFVTLAFLWTTRENIQEEKKGCLSELYSYTFKQDLPLMGYVKEHKELEGRKWLLDDIGRVLLEPETNSNGVAIVAEMRYGISAIFSHLLCAQGEQKGRQLAKACLWIPFVSI